MIHWDRRADRWHLIVTEERPCAELPPTEGHGPCRLVALDPGVATFQTFYDPSGRHGELLRNINADPPSPPSDNLAKARDRLRQARAALTPADHEHWRNLRVLLERQRAAHRDGTDAEWQAARAAVREARAAASDQPRRNAIKSARRRVAHLEAAVAGRHTGSLQASLGRSAALWNARNRLRQHMKDEEHARQHARDIRSLVRWDRRLGREQLRRDALVEHAHYTAARFLLDRYDAVNRTARQCTWSPVRDLSALDGRSRPPKKTWTPDVGPPARGRRGWPNP